MLCVALPCTPFVRLFSLTFKYQNSVPEAQAFAVSPSLCPSISPTTMSLSRLDSTILDLEESTQDLDVFGELDLDPQSPKLANAVFGSARQRAFDKVKASSSRRDSPTLPWGNRSSRSNAKKQPAQEPQNEPVRRPDSPDINTILATTPRPRKISTSAARPGSHAPQAHTASPGTSRIGLPEDSKTSSFETLLELDSDLENEDGGSESDSSLDLHTPLPYVVPRMKHL